MLFYCYDNEFSIKQDTQKYKTNHKWNVNEEAKNLKENHLFSYESEKILLKLYSLK